MKIEDVLTTKLSKAVCNLTEDKCQSICLHEH